MPPTQSQDQRLFQSTLQAYLAAIDVSKIALITAIQHPSKEAADTFQQAHRDEKKTRRDYRKAAKQLRSRIEKR